MEILDQLVDESLKAVRGNLEHRLDPVRRRALYNAFGPRTDTVANRARGWLAVLTAQHVLPMFEQTLPEEDLPRRLLETAVGVLQGTVDSEEAFNEACEGHQIAGNLWGYPETEVPWNVSLAGSTGHRALLEAIGKDPFATNLAWIDFSHPQDEQGKPLEQWSDEDLAQVAGDTASAAAVAFACDPYSPAIKCDPDKFLEFWEWWLSEAVPAAWEAASSQPEPQ